MSVCAWLRDQGVTWIDTGERRSGFCVALISFCALFVCVFLCWCTYNLWEMECPAALVLYSKCMCVCASMWLCLCVQCQRAVKTEQLLFIVTERTAMCRASATRSPYCLPTGESVCVKSERSHARVCNHVPFPNDFIIVYSNYTITDEHICMCFW